MTSPLVSTAWLADRLGDPNLRILDASWHMPADNRDVAAEYRAAHIPGAIPFDIDAVSDQASALPHMLPSPAEFAAAVGGMGISDGDRVVVYDAAGLFSAPRVWWMFRAMGFDTVFVLDGGLPRWVAEGRQVETGAPAERTRSPFTATMRPDLLREANQVLETCETVSAQIVDARSAVRFRGEAPEPRTGLRSGHIPGSLNLPWSQLVADGALLPPAQLAERFAAAGIDIKAPIVTTCGSGVTAAILALGLAVLGREDIPVYDGSWSEWGGDSNLPIERG